MNQTLFLIQNNMPAHSTNRLIVPVLDFARANDHMIWDWSLTSEFDEATFLAEMEKFPYRHADSLLVFGSVGWLKRFNQFQYTRPHLFWNSASFNCKLWSNYYGDSWVNFHGGQMPASVVAGYLDKHGPMHIRPVSDDKLINGGVYDSKRWLSEISEKSVEDLALFWVSAPVEIEAEYRCWIVDNKVVEISQYRRDGVFETLRITDPSMFVIAASLANNHLRVNTTVMDIAVVDGQWKMLEFNPIHCSGWYAADIDHVLKEWVEAL